MRPFQVIGRVNHPLLLATAATEGASGGADRFLRAGGLLHCGENAVLDYPGAPILALAVRAERLTLRIPSRVEWIEKTVQFLSDRAMECGMCDVKRAYRLSLSLHEALTNSVVHGNLEVPSSLKEDDSDAFAELLAKRSADPTYSSREVEIDVDFDGSRCQWTLTDQGRGFDVEKVMRRVHQIPEDVDEHSLDFLLSSGRGILMIESFMDEMRYRQGGRQLVMALEKPTLTFLPDSVCESEPEEARMVPLDECGCIDWQMAEDEICRQLSEAEIGRLPTNLCSAKKILVEVHLSDKILYIPADICNCKSVGRGLFRADFRLPALSDAHARRVREEARSVREAMAAYLKELGHRQLAPDHRREHTRLVYLEIIDIVQPGHPVLHAFARDISVSGIAFIANFPLPHMSMELRLPLDEQEPLHVAVNIVRCERITENVYDVGAQFIGWASSEGTK